jgi:RNA polymerase sigma-70 factor (ECF subfamily)
VDSAGESTLPFAGDGNPLASEAPADWDRLIEAIGPASILVVIESRMSTSLRKRMTPEDIWQEVLLHAWRDRAKCTWRGIKSFRAWLLTIADHRIRDAADHESAAKRGGGKSPIAFSTLAVSDSDGGRPAPFPGPAGSTTPSRVAIHREQAQAMQAALQQLPEELREVVRLRLFDQQPIEAIARTLNIGESAVRHRFRKGSEIYHRRLVAEFATRSAPPGPR